MKNTFHTAALAAAITACAAAAQASDSVGTTGAQFLELPVNARAIAMGSAYSAVAEDASAMHYNPAALTLVRGNDVVLMHALYFQSMKYSYGAAAVRRGEWAFGLQAQHLSAGNVDEIDNTGARTGDSFSPRDLAVGAGVSREFGSLSVGAGAKYISSKLYDTASAFALDAGSLYRMGKFSFALSVANIGRGMKFISERDSLPLTVRGGAGYSGERFTLAADVAAPKGADPYLAAGGEYRCERSEELGVGLALRAGYNSRATGSKLGGMTGFNAGGGIMLDSFNFDYAWSPFGDLGSAHYFSLHIKWGGKS